MPAYKDKAKGTWYASFYFENWTGKKEKKMKRGFKTKREALEWERTFLQQQTADLDMTFESFVALYAADMKGRIKENTWGTKEHILYKKLVPYFGKRKMSEIHSKEVMAWQSEMLNYRDKNGKPYSPVYLKTLHNQLSAVFNHAVKHYNLKANPAAQVGNMGKAKGREMLFWTKAEYLKFADAMMDKPLSSPLGTSTLRSRRFPSRNPTSVSRARTLSPTPRPPRATGSFKCPLSSVKKWRTTSRAYTPWSRQTAFSR